MSAHTEGWVGIGNDSGGGISTSPYTQANGTDANVVAAQEAGAGLWWLSFWTCDAPAGSDTWTTAGEAAGKAAVAELNTFSWLPEYVILDPEGNKTPTTSADWANWIDGWATGVRSGGLTPALYCNESQYKTYGISSFNLPVFIAENPILTTTPTVSGGNIRGYCAFYAACGSSGASQYVDHVLAWGGAVNTVQFEDSGYDCGPN